MRRRVSVILSMLFTVTVCFGCVGCRKALGATDRLYAYADAFAVAVESDGEYAWNTLLTKPEKYGVQRNVNAQYPQFDDDVEAAVETGRTLFSGFKEKFETLPRGGYDSQAATVYDLLDFWISVNTAFYNSPYAEKFYLLGNGLISSAGGAVAEFASFFDMYVLRDKIDLDVLLSLTASTRETFPTYLDYARMRVEYGIPLNDTTLNAMVDYLNSILSKEQDYFLYERIYKKINAVDFLTPTEKALYRSLFAQTLTDSFAVGVRTLKDGLSAFSGNATYTDRTDLAVYGEVGKAYYEWLLYRETGIKDVDADALYAELSAAYGDWLVETAALMDDCETLAPSAYDDFWAYMDGEKAFRDLTEPEEMIAFTKQQAAAIVSPLDNEPTIVVAYIDDTVADITLTAAYYQLSPIDDLDCDERIVFNPIGINDNSYDLLRIVAHEGYPGHLYTHVKSKSIRSTLLPMLADTKCFSEGWAQYVAAKMTDNLYNAEQDASIKYFLRYKYLEMFTGYYVQTIFDFDCNYYGLNAEALAEKYNISVEDAIDMAQSTNALPAISFPYSYGLYCVDELHTKAQTALGEKYDEIAFNEALLSTGERLTLGRMTALADAFIEAAA